MGANRPSLQQRDGRLDPKGLIYNPKLPILCDVCCYYFAVFPKRKLEYHPFSTLSSLESTPTFSSTKIRERDGGLVARLDSNEYYFLYTHPYVPFPSWLRNGGAIRGNIYTPFTSPCKWQLKWITPCIPELYKAVSDLSHSERYNFKSRHDESLREPHLHEWTILVSLHVFRDVSTYLKHVQLPRSGKSWPEISAYDRRPWYTDPFSQSCQIKFKYQTHNFVDIYQSPCRTTLEDPKHIYIYINN